MSTSQTRCRMRGRSSNLGAVCQDGPDTLMRSLAGSLNVGDVPNGALCIPPIETVRQPSWQARCCWCRRPRQ